MSGYMREILHVNLSAEILLGEPLNEGMPI